jgi:hypothetical protein
MYRVIKINAASTIEMESRLNQLRDKDDLELVAVDNGYYIFREPKCEYEIKAIRDQLEELAEIIGKLFVSIYPL